MLHTESHKASSGVDQISGGGARWLASTRSRDEAYVDGDEATEGGVDRRGEVQRRSSG
jgi:hypothetical protein